MKKDNNIVTNDIDIDVNRQNSSFVSLQNIEKIYPNGAKAVYNFNLDIAKNEFIVIVGPSGCGKSTTLRMIGGLEPITNGYLFIDKDLANFKSSRDRKIAMVFQSYALYPQMTVYDNIAFPLKINKYPLPGKDANGNDIIVERKLTKEEIDEKVFEAAKILDLGEYLDRLPRELSGGQMQRVALGRAIVKNVPVFLMDEPLSNLDAKLRLTMRSEIVKLHNKIGATTIYVTHDQTEAMTMATRVVVMSKGFVQQIASPEEIYNHPINLFVAKFIGSPSINIFNGTYSNGTLDINENVSIKMAASFKKRIKTFYENKIIEIENILSNFNKASAEYIKKILSALVDDKTSIKKKVKEKKKLFNFKKEVVVDNFTEEKNIAIEKLEQLKNALNGNCKLTLGIRPERISIRRLKDVKELDNKIIVEATVCELLGADYNVHFDLFGNDMIAKMDAKSPLTEGDKLVVEFLPEDMLIFDPITGDRI